MLASRDCAVKLGNFALAEDKWYFFWISNIQPYLNWESLHER